MAIVFLAWIGNPATAQTVAAAPGTKRHNGPTGKPCLGLSGSAKPQIVNRDLLDHIISIANSCAQRITLHVCYYRSEHCITVDVPPYERKEAVLGVFPKLGDFQAEYKEQF
jgi:hypothetical protein